MELRAYWAIIWRRGWLILLIVAIAAFYVGYELYASRKAGDANANLYHSQVTFQLGMTTKTPPGVQNPYTDRLVAIDTQSDILMSSPILQSTEFDTQVSQQIARDSGAIQQKFGQGADLGAWQDPKAIGDSLTVTRVHSFLTVASVWNTPAGSWAIANAVGEVSARSIGKYLDYSLESSPSSTATVSISPIFIARVVTPASDPTATPNPNPPVKKSTLALILIVALVLGIALAFLVDYLDDSIRSKDEIPDLLRVPVFGEVPRAPASSQTPSVPKKPSVPTTVG